jgi:hypothetical protein
MCPVCVGSALLLLTGAGGASGLAGGIAYLASRGPRPRSPQRNPGPQARAEGGPPPTAGGGSGGKSPHLQ